MKKNLLIFIYITAFLTVVFFNKMSVQAASNQATTNGYILIQTEKNGEAWYVYPKDSRRYFLGRPAQAFDIMKKLSLGAKHDFIAETETFPVRLSGMILLDVETDGQAYYIYPKDLKKYYLGRPDDAFKVMKKLGLGITDNNLNSIAIGEMMDSAPGIPAGNLAIDNVPFTTQAPAGDWADPRQQNGCEEASALMAISWARGQNFTQTQALEKITGISDFELKKYGEFNDTSAQDTLQRIIKDYFGYQDAEFKQNISIEDIIKELKRGHILISPMNGQAMGNRHFRAPGPTTHMVVITGYDADKQIFITNDPGTRYGKNYTYNINIFYNAMRDYPTGHHLPIKQISKDVIVVWK